MKTAKKVVVAAAVAGLMVGASLTGGGAAVAADQVNAGPPNGVVVLTTWPAHGAVGTVTIGPAAQPHSAIDPPRGENQAMQITSTGFIPVGGY